MFSIWEPGGFCGSQIGECLITMGRHLQLPYVLTERWFLPSGRRTFQIAGSFLVSLSLATWASASTTTTKSKTRHAQLSSTHHSSASHHSSTRVTKTATARSHGQHTIDQDRTVAIQNALIREHYLTGDPTGVWDQSSKDAMLRYQAANGWQTRITPDSRALIKLGLGPDHTGLLNPETASFPSPHELGVDNQTQPGGASDNQ
jgi:hypothetical protein